MHGVFVNLRGSRDDDAADVGMDLVSFDDGCGDGEVFKAAVRAGADDDLVDLDFSECPYFFRILRRCGKETTGFMEERSMVTSLA